MRNLFTGKQHLEHSRRDININQGFFRRCTVWVEAALLALTAACTLDIKPQALSDPRDAGIADTNRPDVDTTTCKRDCDGDGKPDTGRDAGSTDAKPVGVDIGQPDAGCPPVLCPLPDAGVDAGPDVGQDAGRDAGRDAGDICPLICPGDAGQDVGTDAGVDAGRDAGVDAGADAGQDAGPGDAGPVIIPYCSDPDGLDLTVQGTTEVGDLIDGVPNPAATVTDACEGDAVREFHCEGDVIAESVLPCPGEEVCVEGVCAPLPWWNPSWLFCRQIAIAGDFPEEHQHLLLLNPAIFNYANTNPDLTDLRFLEGTCDDPDLALGVLAAWAESIDVAGESKIWFKTITPNVATVAVYYGNPVALNIFDPIAVFEFFDGFDAIGEWASLPGGTPCSVAGGLATCGTGQSLYHSLSYLSDEFRGLAVESSVNLSVDIPPTSTGAFGMDQAEDANWQSFGHSLSLQDPPFLNLLRFGSRSLIPGLNRVAGRFVIGGVAIIRDDLAYGYDDSGNIVSSVTDIPTGVIPLHPFIAEDVSPSTYDWIRIRRYIDPEPTSLLGEEQEAP